MADLRTWGNGNRDASRPPRPPVRGGYFDRLAEHGDIYRRDVELIREAFRGRRSVSILDLGFGKGGFLDLAKSYFGVTGVDSNPAAVKQALELGHMVFLEDVRRTHFKDESFDVVYSKEVIEHLTDPLSMMIESNRLLRKGGLVLIICPTNFSIFYPLANFYDDYTHVRPFTKWSLTMLLEEAGFDVLTIEGFTSGRNRIERLLGSFLGRVLPYAWRCVGVKR